MSLIASEPAFKGIELPFELKLLAILCAKISKAKWRGKNIGPENVREQSLKVWTLH